MKYFGRWNQSQLPHQSGRPQVFVSVRDADGVSRNLCSHPSLKKLPGSFPRRIFGTSRHALGRTASSSSSIKHGDTEDDGAVWQFAETEPNRRRSESVLEGEDDTDGTARSPHCVVEAKAARNPMKFLTILRFVCRAKELERRSGIEKIPQGCPILTLATRFTSPCRRSEGGNGIC